ncbi:PadR family transcriptional regulator [Nonomuraea sp. SBT364]|uniref:PadR family transcriptional regulator n=1 Tax=Nonomuraea sp. SBT364 TaxID=1580530 RepID=UPI0022B1A65A|nr:PadR family transcriptional regulator [Nonomuraea sp. SBT364]
MRGGCDARERPGPGERAEEPSNGYRMIQDIEARSRGVWRPGPGSVHPALQQLEDEGLVAGDDSGGSRTHRLTRSGRREAARLHGGAANCSGGHAGPCSRSCEPRRSGQLTGARPGTTVVVPGLARRSSGGQRLTRT